MGNIFSGMDKGEGEVEKDFLGGGSPLPTNIYEAVIKTAYFRDSASSKSKSLNLIMSVGGKEIRNTAWVIGTKGTNKDKNGNNLSGYNQMAALCMLIVGKDIGDMDVEDRTVKLYDAASKKEINQSVDCFVELHEQKVMIALQQIKEDKTKKNENTGDYEPTGETREVNEVVKFFGEDKLVTISEVKEYIKGLGGNWNDVVNNGELLKAVSKIPEEKGVYANKWLESNKDQIWDKSTGKGKTDGKSFSGGSSETSEAVAKKTASLFDD